jgi:hypothetical protein
VRKKYYSFAEKVRIRPAMRGKFEREVHTLSQGRRVLTKTASKEEYNPGARKEARDRPGVTTTYSESVTDD